MVHHPIRWAIGGTLAIAGASRAKWREGTACVRHLYSTPDGFVHVEMDDNNVFVADAEQLQSLHAAKQTHALVRYWINNFQRVDDTPRGGLGDISVVKRLF
jgi:hypothetical protein